MSLNQLTRSDRTCAVYDTSGQEMDGCEHQQVNDPIKYFVERHEKIRTSKHAVRHLSDTDLSTILIDSNALPCEDCLDAGGRKTVRINRLVTRALEEQLRRNRVRDLGEPEPYQILKQTTIAVKLWWHLHHPSAE